jgi:formiminoglutamase
MIRKSKLGSFYFEAFCPQETKKYFVPRLGETRVGDFDLCKSDARFVIIGIEESVGPVANQGFSGAEKAFDSFLRVFINSQVYPDFKIDAISICGSIKRSSNQSLLETPSNLVTELDEYVVQVLTECISKNQIPVVIGGGHNNAFPLIKWCSNQDLINVINLDPHADCRNTENRHSGNSFSWALEQNLLSDYAVLGLHEAFNNSFIRQFLKNNNLKHTFYEDYLLGNRNLVTDALEIVKSWNDLQKRIAFEIDMDCIANMPSSAASPSGWTIDQVRSYLMQVASKAQNVAYLHLPEAAPLNEYEAKMVGKALTYLVRDFVQNLN